MTRYLLIQLLWHLRQQAVALTRSFLQRLPLLAIQLSIFRFRSGQLLTASFPSMAMKILSLISPSVINFWSIWIDKFPIIFHPILQAELISLKALNASSLVPDIRLAPSLFYSRKKMMAFKLFVVYAWIYEVWLTGSQLYSFSPLMTWSVIFASPGIMASSSALWATSTSQGPAVSSPAFAATVTVLPMMS